MSTAKLRSHCPINFGLETFGDKWSLLIIRDMMFFGKETYKEFQQSEEAIATNILADRLLLLENEGIISKEVNPANRTKFIYSLTEKGINLLPIILEMAIWSGVYDKDSRTDDLLTAMKADKVNMTAQFMGHLRNKLQERQAKKAEQV